MKKILAMVLAMMLVLSMSVAFAADTTDDKIIKKYVDEEGDLIEDPNLYPYEELKLEVVSSSVEDNSYAPYTATDTTKEAIPEITVTKAADSEEFVVGGIENIKGVGKFTYTMKEVPNGTAGVTNYDTTTIFTVSVLRSYVIKKGVTTEEIEYDWAIYAKNGETKVAEIKNTYEDGSLAISKNVTGNMANDDHEFTVEVYFTSDKPVKTDITCPDSSKIEFDGEEHWTGPVDGIYTSKTVTLTVKASNGAYTFSNIAKGLVAHVKETDTGVYSFDNYTVNGTKSNADQADGESVVITNETATVEITNIYEQAVATGITLDNAPYMILMALVVVAGAALIVKRASANR